MAASDVASLVRRQGNRLNLLVQSGSDHRGGNIYNPNEAFSSFAPLQASYASPSYQPPSYQQATHVHPVYVSPGSFGQQHQSQPASYNSYTDNTSVFNSSNTVRIRNAGAPTTSPQHATAAHHNQQYHPQQHSLAYPSAQDFHMAEQPSYNYSNVNSAPPYKSYPSTTVAAGRGGRTPGVFQHEAPDTSGQSRLQQLLDYDRAAQQTAVIEGPIRPSAYSGQQHLQPMGGQHQLRSVSSISLSQDHASSTFPRRTANTQQKTAPIRKGGLYAPAARQQPSRRWEHQLENSTAKVQSWIQHSTPPPSAPPTGTGNGIMTGEEEEAYVHVPVKSRVGNFEAMVGGGGGQDHRPVAAATLPANTRHHYPSAATGPRMKAKLMTVSSHSTAPVAHVNASEAEELLHVDPKTRGELGEVTEDYTDF